jgi:hypothetical protein
MLSDLIAKIEAAQIAVQNEAFSADQCATRFARGDERDDEALKASRAALVAQAKDEEAAMMQALEHLIAAEMTLLRFRVGQADK